MISENEVIKDESQTSDNADKCCGCRKKERTDKERSALLNRLARLEGQVRGIGKMLKEDAYCADILIQVAATRAALGSFAKELMGAHIRTCVVEDVRDGGNEKTEELIALISRLMG